MTNMVPQAPRSNQQMWAGLEDYCRTLVGAGNELYIICGSYGRGGTGSNGYATTLDNGASYHPHSAMEGSGGLAGGRERRHAGKRLYSGHRH